MDLTDRFIEGLGPTLRDTAGPLLDDLAAGLTEQLATTDELLTPAEQPWATVYDLDTTPQPAWLGQSTGTRFPPGLTVEQQRDYVRNQAAWRRGRVDALAAAIQSVLGGEKRVGFLERHDGAAWRLTVLVYQPDAAGVTEDQIRAAAATQKAVGLVVDNVEVIPTITYADFGEIYTSYEDLSDAWPAFPISPERDVTGARWWRPAGTFMRYVRSQLVAPTYASRTSTFASYRDSRDHDPNDES